eukprot:TRINITY_DN12681_c0_g1_i2.p1 TRINITY_DN12681_c0_g1~~TRINITY_DN12681_c0_g1_i2.p1  ORF type:complete len:169 (+),score=21.71 TRINITY_DN12681_c0_g1_i2:96-602(+)
MKGDPSEEAKTLYKNEHLKVILRDDNQCWIGRCIIVPHEHLSPFALYESHLELLLAVSRVIAMLNRVFKKLYGMVISNILQLGNLTTNHKGETTTEDPYYHVHFHYIPRYETGHVVTIEGFEFRDKQWGKALNIDPNCGLEIVKPPENVLKRIVTDIRSCIDTVIKEK